MRAAFRFAQTAVVVAAVGMATVAVSPAASAKDLIVKYDQSQLIRLPRAITEIIIGNPSIADVTVQSSNMLVITGKTFGITNVIALDANRNVIQEQRIMVIRDDLRQVSVYKGAKRETYSCAPACNPTIMVGDDSKFFDDVVKGAQGKTKFSDAAAEGPSGGQN
jgi:hypothetical protein